MFADCRGHAYGGSMWFASSFLLTKCISSRAAYTIMCVTISIHIRMFANYGGHAYGGRISNAGNVLKANS